MWGIGTFLTLFSEAPSQVDICPEICDLHKNTHQQLTQLSTEPKKLLTTLNQLYVLADHVLMQYRPQMTYPDSMHLFNIYKATLDKLTAVECEHTTALLTYLEESNDPIWQRTQTFLDQNIIFDDVSLKQQQIITLCFIQLAQQTNGRRLIEKIASFDIKLHLKPGDEFQVYEDDITHQLTIFLPHTLDNEHAFTFGLKRNLISTPNFIQLGHELCHVLERLDKAQPPEQRRYPNPHEPTFWCYRKYGIEYDQAEFQTIEGKTFSENWLRSSFGLPLRGSHNAMDTPEKPEGIEKLNRFLGHVSSRRRNQRYSESTMEALVKETLQPSLHYKR